MQRIGSCACNLLELQFGESPQRLLQEANQGKVLAHHQLAAAVAAIVAAATETLLLLQSRRRHTRLDFASEACYPADCHHFLICQQTKLNTISTLLASSSSQRACLGVGVLCIHRQQTCANGLAQVTQYGQVKLNSDHCIQLDAGGGQAC